MSSPTRRAAVPVDPMASEPPPTVPRELIEYVPPELLAALAGLGAIAGVLLLLVARSTRQRKSAEQAALTDPLTRLTNRAAFDHRLAVEWERARRHGRPLGVLVLDLDGFKAVNDRRGHAAGDDLLRNVGATIASRLRRSDLGARLGGDEFVILAPETTLSGLESLGEALREAIENLPIGVSVGAAQREPGDADAEAMVRRADLAMYSDKERGRAPVTEELAAAA